jgi:hypothetical protein
VTGEADSLAELDSLFSEELDSLVELPVELPDDSLAVEAVEDSPDAPLVLDSVLELSAAAFAAAALAAAAFLAAAALTAAAFLAAVSPALEELLATSFEPPVVVFVLEESPGS